MVGTLRSPVTPAVQLMTLNVIAYLPGFPSIGYPLLSQLLVLVMIAVVSGGIVWGVAGVPSSASRTIVTIVMVVGAATTLVISAWVILRMWTLAVFLGLVPSDLAPWT